MLLSKKSDLGLPPRLALEWEPAQAEASLRKVFELVTALGEDTIHWYIRAKNMKRFWARGIRLLSILFGTTAALLPTLGEIFAGEKGKSSIPAGWTAIMLGTVGALLLLDRLFGFSTGWMRYISTELQIRQIAQELQIDWEAERASWQGKPPDKDQILQTMARFKTFTVQINNIVREETSAWVQEFETAIRQLDEAAKARTAATEPGALNLVVSNGDEAADGWALSIDNGTPEQYRGKTAGKRSLLPGRHEIKIVATINGKTVEAEKVATVPAGGTCEEVLTLS